MNLRDKHCVPCQGNEPPLTLPQAKDLMEHVPGWTLSQNGEKISREYTFKNFDETIQFVNMVAELSETEGHHPDIHIFYNKLTLELFTHAIGGLSESDFILAAKINDLQL